MRENKRKKENVPRGIEIRKKSFKKVLTRQETSVIIVEQLKKGHMPEIQTKLFGGNENVNIYGKQHH